MLAVIGNDTFLYKVFFLLHILSALVAFAPLFVWPIMNVQLRKRGDGLPRALAQQATINDTVVHGPAILLAGVFGILMVVTSTETVGGEKLFEFSQLWISLAFVLWFGLLGVMYGLLVPAQKKAAEGDADAAKKVSMFGGITHTLLFVMLIVMIWKPGGPF